MAKAATNTKKKETKPAAGGKKPAGRKPAAAQAHSANTGETVRWVGGVALILFGLFLLIAVGSYFFTWQADQSFSRFGDITSPGGEIANLAGRTGAKMADRIVGEWFGYFGILAPVALVILGLRIVSGRRSFLSRYIRISLLAMILGSLTLGLIFTDSFRLFGTGAGGAHGIYVSEFLRSYLGTAGAGLVLLLAWILLGLYVNSTRTMRLINRMGKGIYDGGVKVGEAVREHTLNAKEDRVSEEELDELDVPNPYAESQDDDIAPWEGPERREDELDDEEDDLPEYEREEYGESERPEPARGTDPDDMRWIAAPESGKPAAAREDESDIFVITDARANREEEAEPLHTTEKAPADPRVVVLGEEAGSYIRPADNGRKPEEDASRYAGGVGIYAEGGAAPEETAGGLSVGSVSAARGANAVGGGLAGGANAVGGAATGGTNAATGVGTGTGAVADGPFQVVDARAANQETNTAAGGVTAGGAMGAGTATPSQGAKLSTGGVVETAAGGGVEPGGQLKVVVAGHSDAQLSDDEIENSLYDPTRELSRYQKPHPEILDDHSIEVQVTEDEIYENKDQIVRTLKNFGIGIDKIKATIGPTVTLYEIIPAPGVKISKIKNLEDDIALSLKALGIRIIAPMPGKGTVGIEVPNKDKEIVSMYSVVKSARFQNSDYELPVVLGRTISNENYMIDLAKMPHLLVAGATGQGKSVGLNAIITSLLYKKHPAELKFVMVDPKRVELSLYSRLEKHFLAKMESEDEAILTDTQKVVYTLNSLCELMSRRYDLLRMAEVKKISEYNEKFINRRLNPNKGHEYMPYIVVVIDEFADMIMTAGREVEAPITRLAQLARAVGIHLVIATQRPDVKVITGLIKANFPARIAFRVTSMVDSRTILDQPGANQLIGRGDMLMSINGEVTRVQCAFIDTPEIERITEFISNQKGYPAAYSLPDYEPEGDGAVSKGDLGKIDDMFEEVARAVVQAQEFSTSWIQRNYSIGYNRAGRITDQLEKAGIIGRANGSKPREVLIADPQTLERIFERLWDTH